MRFPAERVEAWARFDTFFQEEHERLFKALYFVTGQRHDAEELMQDAFLRRVRTTRRNAQRRRLSTSEE